MTKKEKEQVRNLFEDTLSVECVLNDYPNIDTDELLDYLVESGSLVERPKKVCMAGNTTDVVSDNDLLPRIIKCLAKGMSDRGICAKYHLGRTRLVKLKEKFGLKKGMSVNYRIKNSAKTEENICVDSDLLAQVQPLMKEHLLLSKIAANLSIDIDTIIKIESLLQLTKVPDDKVSKEGQIPTLEEKIVYANQRYGKGRWMFVTKDTIKDYCLQRASI